jgi:hypothetical protein
MPLNESRRDLSPECEAESTSVREHRGPHRFLVILPRDVLAGPTNQEHEVDAAEKAKQVAYTAMNSPASCTNDDEIRSFYEDDIVNFDTEQSEAITFRSWLHEHLLHSVFYEKATVDTR